MSKKDDERKFRRREAGRANLQDEQDLLEPVPSPRDQGTIEIPWASLQQTSSGYPGSSWRAGRAGSSLSSGMTEMSDSDANSRYREADLGHAGQWQALYDVRFRECQRLTAENKALQKSFAQIKDKYDQAKLRSAGLEESKSTLMAKNAEIMRAMRDLGVQNRDLEQKNTMLRAEQDIQLSLTSDLQTQLSLCNRGFGPDPTSEAAFQAERQRHTSEMTRLQKLLDKTQMKFALKSNECISKSNQLEAEVTAMRTIKMDYEFETNDLIRRLDACNDECFELRTRQNFSGLIKKRDAPATSSSAHSGSVHKPITSDDQLNQLDTSSNSCVVLHCAAAVATSTSTVGWVDLSPIPSSSSSLARVDSGSNYADIPYLDICGEHRTQPCYHHPNHCQIQTCCHQPNRCQNQTRCSRLSGCQNQTCCRRQTAGMPLSKPLPESAVLPPSKPLPDTAVLPPFKPPPESDVLPPSKPLPDAAVLPPSKPPPESVVLPPSKPLPDAAVSKKVPKHKK